MQASAATRRGGSITAAIRTASRSNMRTGGSTSTLGERSAPVKSFATTTASATKGGSPSAPSGRSRAAAARRTAAARCCGGRRAASHPLQPVRLVAVAKPDEIGLDPAHKSEHLEQLAHLGGRSELLHRARLAQVIERLRIAAALELLE